MTFRNAVLSLLVAVTSGCAPALFVTTRPDASLYREPPANAITFWGHACVYVDVDGFGIVTDPVFGGRYSPFNGRKIPTPPPGAYDQTRVILISHAHQDHLQPKTLARFSREAVILCPAPCAEYVRGLGPRVRLMRPGDEYAFPGGSIVAVAADHPGERWSREERADGGALGYVIRTQTHVLYYSGDTKLFDGIEAVGRKFGPDVAILNVNAHLKPKDAMRAERELGSPRVIASHTGAYGGIAGRRGRAWHREFLALAGSLGVPLQVGQSVSLASIPARARASGVTPSAPPTSP